MKYTLSLKVQNTAGVLSHVASLFTRRSYNINSLSVGVTEDERFSIINLVVNLTNQKIEYLIHQLYKLIDVIEIQNLTGTNSYKRELVCIKVKVTPKTRSEILRLSEAYNAKMVDLVSDQAIFELVELPVKISSFIELMREFHIIEIRRTGTIALKYVS